MVKHGASHGFSVLFCTIISAFLIELLKPFFPHVVEKVKSVTSPVLQKLHIPMSPDYFNILILAFLLAILWGVFFKLRYDRYD
jgi:hypothetical protein